MSNKISASDVKELRDLTGAGVMDAKAALAEAGGDLDKAQKILKKKGQLKAAKKAERETKSGLVESYVHGEGRIGVLVEVNCETDFVARNQEFKSLVHDLALQVAAQNPIYVSREDVPAAVLEKQKEMFADSASAEGKPGNIVEKIVTGKLEKYFQDSCLLEQPFVKDPDMTVRELINQKIAKTGENIQVRRFSRYVLGE